MVSESECPAESKELHECTSTMDNYQQCEADQTLPDGNANFNVNNCDLTDIFDYDEWDSGDYYHDVYMCVREGKIHLPTLISFHI